MYIILVLFPLGAAFLIVGFVIERCWGVLWRKERMGFPATLRPEDHLITHGIFNYVRHPHNLMVILESLGISFISLGLYYLGIPLSWTLLPSCCSPHFCLSLST